MEQKLFEQWFKRKAFLESGKESEAREELDKIEKLLEERVVENADVIAGALLFEGKKHIDEHQYDRAIEIFKEALRLDSSLYQAYFGIARAHFYKNRFNPFAYVYEFFKGIFTGFGTFWLLFNTLSNIYILLYFTLFLAAVFTVILGAVRNFYELKHEIEERFPENWKGGIKSLISVGFIFLPLLFWLDPFWLILFWLIIFWRYFGRTEKSAAVLVLVLLVLTIPSLKIVDRLYSSTQDLFVRSSISALSGDYNKSQIKRLQSVINKYPEEEKRLRFIIAQLYQNGGYYEQAKKNLEKIIKKNPASFKVLVNLGNLYYLSDEPFVAIKTYKKALDINPESAKVYYNMSLAYSKGFKFSKADRNMNKARELNSGLVAEYTNRQRSTVINEYQSAWNIFIDYLFTSREAYSSTESISPYKLFLNYYSILAVVLVVVLVFYNRVFGNMPEGRTCFKCGRPFCEKCKFSVEYDNYCSQCEHLYIKKDGVSPETRLEKMYQVERHHRLKRILKTVMNIFIPGSGFNYEGKNLLGFSLLLILCLGASIIVLRTEVITFSKGIISTLQFPATTVGIVLLILSWVIANPLAWWRKF